MEISPIILIKLLLYSVIWGAIIGFLFSINKIFRIFFDIDSKKIFDEKSLDKKIKPKIFKYKNQAESSVIFIQDLFVTVIYVIGLLLINYSMNKGVFRFFSIPASIIGFFLFKFTLGKLVLMIFEWLSYKIKIGILFIFNLIYRPLIYISSKICVFCKKNYTFLKNSIAKQIKKRYNNYKERSLDRIAKSAFLKIERFDRIE